MKTRIFTLVFTFAFTFTLIAQITISGKVLGRNNKPLKDVPTKPELNGKFAFYAHLDRIDVKIGQLVKAGTQIGLTGDTGNANGMTTEKKGGHLHFEIRTIQNPGLGLGGRINPEPFVKF